MSFKDSFERWKCLAVADRVGERIPGFYSRVREGSVAVPFATESRDAKNSSVQCLWCISVSGVPVHTRRLRP